MVKRFDNMTYQSNPILKKIPKLLVSILLIYLFVEKVLYVLIWIKYVLISTVWRHRMFILFGSTVPYCGGFPSLTP